MMSATDSESWENQNFVECFARGWRGHRADPRSGPPLVRAWAALWHGPSAEGLIDVLGPNGHYFVPGLPPFGVDAEGRGRAASLFELLPGLQGQLVRFLDTFPLVVRLVRSRQARKQLLKLTGAETRQPA